MTTNPALAYPAEYYYPEFIDNRYDDPRKSPPTNLPVTSSIDNGVGSSTTTTKTTAPTILKKPVNKKPVVTSLALDIVTNQGLPDTDLTKAVKTDPKKSLLRDPAERNIPRLIVDDSVIKQAVRTPKIVTTNLDYSFEQKPYSNRNKPIANGHMNGGLTKQQPIQHVEHEQPVDDYWKKEVYIDDEGAVTIEPLKYDKNTYEGPFGLTRQGSFIFYIGIGIFTLLAAVFLIMTGVFYGQSYPDSSSNSGKLAGIGICALAFYIGLQLLLIGLWHQKYRQENPVKKVKKRSTVHNESSDHLKSSMENNEQYNYSYQPPMDYTPYGIYSNPSYPSNANPSYPSNTNPSYPSNTNEPTLFQQPGAATGAGYYEPTLWASNAEVETQPDPKFSQSMEWAYAPPPIVESPSTVVTYTSPPSTTITTTKSEKKSHRNHRHHHKKKTVEVEPFKPKFDSVVPNSTIIEASKPKFDSVVPNSTVIEAPLPILSKAPETNELIKSIAEMEKNAQQTSRTKEVDGLKSFDSGTQILSFNDHSHHHHHRHHSRHHHHQHHRRRRSYSPCSTCSDRSRKDFHSDVGPNYQHHHHHYHRKHSEPVKTITPRPYIPRTISPRKLNRTFYRDTGIGTGLETKIMRDSSVTADLEDVPNVRDDRREQIPIIRRTIIVEPYPAQPSAQILVKPRSDMIGKIRLGKNNKSSDDDETTIYPATTFINKRKKKKTKTTTDNIDGSIEELRLDGMNDNGNESMKSKKKHNKLSSKKNVKNAFYD